MTSTSFISEHTAEYYITSFISNNLSNLGIHSIPFYYWKTREGSRKSKMCVGGEYRLMAVYARRPKIEIPKQDEISIKINRSLFVRAKILKEYSVPVFIGIPLASSILDLSLDMMCRIWYLNPEKIPDEDIIFTTSIKKDQMGNEERHFQHVNEKELSEIILKKTEPKTWINCIETINASIFKSRFEEDLLKFMWFGDYKPFYMIITTDK